MKIPKLVLIESPYAGDIERNLRYARACMRDSFMRGEFPWASHITYTQDGILDDAVPEERALGIEAGLQWGKHAELTAVYVDLGISPGMKLGVERARAEGRAIEVRSLDEWAGKYLIETTLADVNFLFDIQKQRIADVGKEASGEAGGD